MEKTWKITLADGTILDNLGLNGSNFVSETEVKEDLFSGKLSTVTIENTETGEAQDYSNLQLIQIAHYPDMNPPGWYIAFREIPEQEAAIEQQFTDLQLALCEVYEMLTL